VAISVENVLFEQARDVPAVHSTIQDSFSGLFDDPSGIRPVLHSNERERAVLRIDQEVGRCWIEHDGRKILEARISLKIGSTYANLA
jgi:hypothetical protein